MTNAEIIFNEQLNLMQEDKISTTGRTITVKNSDGTTETLPEPEAIHTFQYWKDAGRSVKKGEKAIAKFAIWKHTAKMLDENTGNEANDAMNRNINAHGGEEKMFLKTSYFFALHQTEPAIKHEEAKEEAEEAKQEPAQEEPKQEQEVERPEEEIFSGTVTPRYYEINEAAARRHKEMSSYDDYKAGSATAGYRAEIDKATKILEKVLEKCQTEAQREHAKALYEKYCKAYAEYINRENEIGTRCPSILITGGSNFPVKKKEKQVAAWEKNYEYYKYTQEILEKLKGAHRQGLRVDDPEALPAMREKLEKLKATQEDMKRKNAEARKAGQPQPCPAWMLSNNNANIHRVESRVKELEAAQNTETVTLEKDGYTYEENTADMRVRFIFSGKPDDQTREALKNNGFRWAPSVGAWQRQLNANGKYAAEKVMEKLEA